MHRVNPRFGPLELVHPLPACSPSPFSWLLDNFLPQHDLVLLDGPSGVGKSLLAASLAASITKLPNCDDADVPRVIWADDFQFFCSAHRDFLARHKFQDGRLLRFNLDRRQIEEKPSANTMWDFLNHLDKLCEQVQPRLVILDGLEDHLGFLADLKPLEIRKFYRNLRAIAWLRKTCILVLRHQGLHQPRQGGPLAKIGSQESPITLTLSWHPHDTNQRLLSIAKNKFGPTGNQYLMQIDNQGVVTTQPIPQHQRIKLFNTPLPHLPAARRTLVPEIADKIIARLSTPMTAADLRRCIVSDEGYTYTAFRKALRSAGVKTLRRGDTWWYLFDHHTLPQLTNQLTSQTPAGIVSPPSITAGGHAVTVASAQTHTPPTGNLSITTIAPPPAPELPPHYTTTPDDHPRHSFDQSDAESAVCQSPHRYATTPDASLEPNPDEHILGAASCHSLAVLR